MGERQQGTERVEIAREFLNPLLADVPIPWNSEFHGEPDLTQPPPSASRGHAMRWITRTVTYGAWRPVDECEPVSVIHQCPPYGSTTMPCCGRTPFEAPSTDRMCTDPEQVTCTEPTTTVVTSGDMAVELPGVEPDRVVDLMEALEQSVAAAKAARKRHPQTKREEP